MGCNNTSTTDKVNKLVEKLNRALTSKFTGKNDSSRLPPGTYDRLAKMHKALNTTEIVELTEAENILVNSINDGIKANDIKVLNYALDEIESIKNTGKNSIADHVKAKAKAKNELVELFITDIVNLSIEEQKIKDEFTRMSQLTTEELDLGTVIALINEAGLKIRPENFNNNPKELALAGWRMLSKKEEGPLSNKLFKPILKKMGQISIWGYKDLDAMLNSVSRRGGTTGILADGIDLRLREANENIYDLGDTHTLEFGSLVAETFGYKVPEFKGDKAKIKELNFYRELVQEHVVKSSNKIKTGISDSANNEIILEQGELMQLYMDSLNPNNVQAIEAAGISEELLLELVNKYLTDQERAFAMNIVHRLFPKMMERESKVYEKLYFTKMPVQENYGGQVGYDGDAELKNPLSPDGNATKASASLVLSNNKAPLGKKINLHRNAYSNTLQRMGNSAQFVGGAEIHSEIYTAWNDPRIKSSLEKNNAANYHQAINQKIQENFKLVKHDGGKVGPTINFIKGALVHTALAAKIKLAITQKLSSVLWLDNADTISGFKRPTELKDVNIAELLYNNSATLRDRYAGNNIIALDADIEASAGSMDAMFNQRGMVGKNWDRVKYANMAFTRAGDNVGIMALGTRFYIGRYKAHRAAGLSEAAAQKKAIADFNKKWQKAQQSYEAIDRADIQKGIWGLFTMFMTSPFQLGRHSIDAVRQLARHATPGKEGKGTVKEQALRFTLYHFYSSLSYQFVVNALPKIILGGWDDEDEEELLWNTLKGPWINSVFLLGDAVTMLENQLFGHKFETDIGQTTAFSGLTRVSRNLIKLMEYYSKPYLTYEQEQKKDILLWNTWMEMAQVLGVASKSYGFFKDKEGVTKIQKVGEGLLSGKGDPAEALLLLSGYSNYTVDNAKETFPKRKKNKGKRKKLNAKYKNK